MLGLRRLCLCIVAGSSAQPSAAGRTKFLQHQRLAKQAGVLDVAQHPALTKLLVGPAAPSKSAPERPGMT